MQQQNTQTEPLIYERAAGLVYARYANPKLRHIDRWIIGSCPEAFERINKPITDKEWEELYQLAAITPTLKHLLDQTITLYKLVRDNNGR
jgi:hypothetical protein